MAKKKTVEQEIDDMQNDFANDILQTNELQQAIDLINKEHSIESLHFEHKRFLVAKNDKISDIINKTDDSDDSKFNLEMDEIANQADQAFQDLMDIVSDNCLPQKGVSEMASAAQSFLSLKLQSKMAKAEIKLRRLQQQLQRDKFDQSIKPKVVEDDDNDEDMIEIIE